MKRKEFLGAVALLSLLCILFTPIDSDVWKNFVVVGVVFGIGWFILK